MGDCAPAFDPNRDPPDSLYGFTRDEWVRAGGPVAYVVAHWDELLAVAHAGRGIGIEMEGFVAIGRLSPDHARRAIARLEPAFSQDLARWDAAVRAGAHGADLVRQVHPDLAARVSAEDAALVADDLAMLFRSAAEFIALARGG